MYSKKSYRYVEELKGDNVLSDALLVDYAKGQLGCSINDLIKCIYIKCDYSRLCIKMSNAACMAYPIMSYRDYACMVKGVMGT